jgi:predicted ATPase
MTTPAISVSDWGENPIVQLVLRNFRAFETQSIGFAPITIFVGPNNAGKSSALSAIRILSQTLQSADPAVPLSLGEFGTFRDVVHGNNPKKTFGIRLGMRLQRRSHSFEVNFQYRTQRRQVVQQSFVANAENEEIVRTRYSPDRERQIFEQIAGFTSDEVTKLKARFFHFLPRVFELRMMAHRKSAIPALNAIDEFITVATRKLSGLQYLGPFRDAPLRAYPLSGERPSILTPTGKGATDILVADFFRRGSRKRALSKSVQAWLSRAGIASELQVHTLGDRQYDIRLKHPITGEIENLADVGYGISQVLPVLVAGYNQSPSSVFMVEQPELHLHPRAQSELGDFFCDLYEAGVQSIIETHSEHLILRLQRHVASGRLRATDLAVNFVHSGETGKIVTPLPLNEDGIFTEKWPQGFFEERLDEALGLARAPLIRKGELE